MALHTVPFTLYHAFYYTKYHSMTTVPGIFNEILFHCFSDLHKRYLLWSLSIFSKPAVFGTLFSKFSIPQCPDTVKKLNSFVKSENYWNRNSSVLWRKVLQTQTLLVPLPFAGFPPNAMAAKELVCSKYSDIWIYTNIYGKIYSFV